MRKRGEITVFLSLCIVCILSLFLGLLESARTAGARWYLQMSADSAAASVMSQYNRNLWDLYHILFLESASHGAVEESFTSYLKEYVEQENMYPLQIRSVAVKHARSMMEEGGRPLEQEILSYAKYRLPEIAEDLTGLAGEAKEAAKAGDFRQLFEVCRDTGKQTRKLEKQREKLEKSLREMGELFSDAVEAAEQERESRYERCIRELQKNIRQFPDLVDGYEREVVKFAEYIDGNAAKGTTDGSGGGVTGHQETADNGTAAYVYTADSEAVGYQNQQQLAGQQVREAAENQLTQYREMEQVLENTSQILGETEELLEAGTEEEDEREAEEEEESDVWEEIRELLAWAEIPKPLNQGEKDEEKAAAFDRLEEVLSGELLALVLPEEVRVSENMVSLSGSVSNTISKMESFSSAETGNILEQMLINEYCFLSFDSFMETKNNQIEDEKQPLFYEQEYLLCGENTDRDNLASTVERLLAVRAAMNLLYLLNSPVRKAEADGLAMAISGGNAPVQLVLSFLILSMWALGEGILDVKQLMHGSKVSFWKTDQSWNLSLTELLALGFTGKTTGNDAVGSSYQDYLRVLFFLMSTETRNARLMDLIQWNVRTKQADFLITDCIHEVEIEAQLSGRHLFFLKDEYDLSVTATGAY